jgi:hypothetical protein
LIQNEERPNPALLVFCCVLAIPPFTVTTDRILPIGFGIGLAMAAQGSSKFG